MSETYDAEEKRIVIRDLTNALNRMQSERAALAAQLTEVTRERDEALKTLRITSLAVPLEDELYGRIDEICKDLLMEQGVTLSGIGRLFIDCQRRMTDDWEVIGRQQRELKSAQASLAPLRAVVEAARDFVELRNGPSRYQHMLERMRQALSALPADPSAPTPTKA